MKEKVKILLAVDEMINLILGLLLLLFTVGILDLFGLPSPDTYFYNSILGGCDLRDWRRAYSGMAAGQGRPTRFGAGWNPGHSDRPLARKGDQQRQSF